MRRSVVICEKSPKEIRPSIVSGFLFGETIAKFVNSTSLSRITIGVSDRPNEVPIIGTPTFVPANVSSPSMRMSEVFPRMPASPRSMPASETVPAGMKALAAASGIPGTVTSKSSGPSLPAR